MPGHQTAQKAIREEQGSAADGEEILYWQAVALVWRRKRVSVSLLQRRMRIGYSRAARLIDRMETEGSKARAVLSLTQEIVS